MHQLQPSEPVIYQGQFGEYTITESDRQGVIVYRSSLLVAALSFALGTCLALFAADNPLTLLALTPLYGIFCLALGVSLLTIHIYMAFLHRLLQIFWAIGAIAAIGLAFYSSEPLALFIYSHPLAIFGVGFTFAALTGIYFKEAFCFNRLETKVLTPVVPVLLLSHLTGIFPPDGEKLLLAMWSVLFVIFALRKMAQLIPADIGDKSVFAYLKAS